MHRDSASANFPVTDLRSATRVALLLRSAKLVCDQGEYLCVLRDVSATGAKVKLFHPLPTNAKFQLQLANGDSFPATRVWERDGHMGLHFDAPIDVRRLVQEVGPYRKRAIRLKLEVPALIAVGEVTVPAVVKDLSQQGAQIECGSRFALDQKVRLQVHGLPILTAKVRWRRPPAVGLVFEQTFQLAEFAKLAAELQRTSRALSG